MNKDFIKDRDGLNDRLLLFMKKNTSIPFTQIKQIKHGVWLLSSSNQSWVLKEFPSKYKLSVQITFSKELKQKGYAQTYSFFPDIFQIDDRIYGLMQYIESNESGSFHYNSEKNIEVALEAIVQFHTATSKIVPSFIEHLPIFKQLAKWEKRLVDYFTFINLHRFNPVYSHLNRLAQYGSWALQQMQEHKSYFHEEPFCIIHGDVASHNFIKGKNGEVYMIDFDLISIAPPQIDFLQFSNRILPSLEWNEDRLFSFEKLRHLQNVRPFLAALVYPTDIFREWIFYSNSQLEVKSKKWNYVKQLTFERYKERLAFYERIINIVENNSFPTSK
ncbi:phosphotransferase [Lederbergia wuyishanensis]|uniref:Aminoglycoside phosphotransferase domain-containing protein n=1 Tax=Lederbergia wuyishanensis TaxID=1347903 RepID=A0ABU0D1R2_9BACI|nr:phosphotransferase [Lederbergia wuyishanensis]MCJ8006956.1 aminoglycoside phosphotransferase family protein [Lederbergia wuyishanensis]MDQ0342340.1 hypothetical protein [Lederbergia wuyishanensis]